MSDMSGVTEKIHEIVQKPILVDGSGGWTVQVEESFLITSPSPLEVAHVVDKRDKKYGCSDCWRLDPLLQVEECMF